MTGPTSEDRLESLLRTPVIPLEPEPGLFEQVRRRGQRRRTVRRLATVAATVVVVAGIGVPVGLSLRAPSTGGGNGPAANSHHLTSPAPQRPAAASKNVPRDLVGFAPQSMSFVSQDDGWLVGADGPRRVEVARTTGDGAGWLRLPNLTMPSSGAQVRFADPLTGFIFGSGLYQTVDGGKTWMALRSPGYINDLEVRDGEVYALVSRCAGCHGQEQLYTAALNAPDLQPVTQVTGLVAPDAALTVQHDTAFVLDHEAAPRRLWMTSDEGRTWSQRTVPCHGGAASLTLSQWDDTALTATCTANGGAPTATAPRSLFTSTDGGAHWTEVLWTIPNTPDIAGQTALTADGTNVVVDGWRNTFQVSTSGGLHWSGSSPHLLGRPRAALVRQVSFIGTGHLVSILTADGTTAFATSLNAGRSWRVTDFG